MSRAFPIALTLGIFPSPAMAEDWPEAKCRIFSEAWATSAPASGPSAPSEGFRSKVEGFIASGCSTARDACPETEADVAIYDALALIVALEGMATTFLPVQCPERPRLSDQP